ncbi:MAG: conserved rane protein of unknown function [Rhizobium sp.]|nr:conserved rane protein of unknown function [Rhizobium sp.]
MSPSTAIFWPIIAQIVLVYALYYRLWARRAQAVKAGSATVGQFRDNLKEPAESLSVRNSLANQFELPPLFFVICIAIYVTGYATLYPVLLAWAFVATRLAHAYIHVSTNRIRHRMPLFAAGLLINALLLLWLAVNIALN